MLEYRNKRFLVSSLELEAETGKKVWTLGTLLHYLEQGQPASRLAMKGGAHVTIIGPGLAAPSDLEYQDVVLLGTLERVGIESYLLRAETPAWAAVPFPGAAQAEPDRIYTWAGWLDCEGNCQLTWETGKKVEISHVEAQVAANGPGYCWLAAQWDPTVSGAAGRPRLSPYALSWYRKRADLPSLEDARGERLILQGECFHEGGTIGMVGLLLEDDRKVELIFRKIPAQDVGGQAILLGKLYGDEMAGLGMSRTRAHDKNGDILPRLLVDRVIEIP